jgi:hypothetical protein
VPPDADPPFPAAPLPPAPLPPELLAIEPPLAFVLPLPDEPPDPLPPLCAEEPPLPPLPLGPAHEGAIRAVKENAITPAATHELLLLITRVPLVAGFIAVSFGRAGPWLGEPQNRIVGLVLHPWGSIGIGHLR